MAGGKTIFKIKFQGGTYMLNLLKQAVQDILFVEGAIFLLGILLGIIKNPIKTFRWMVRLNFKIFRNTMRFAEKVTSKIS